MGGVRLTPHGTVRDARNGKKADWQCKDCRKSGTATTGRRAEVDLKRHHKAKHSK
jgi:hypothetical protein